MALGMNLMKRYVHQLRVRTMHKKSDIRAEVGTGNGSIEALP